MNIEEYRGYISAEMLMGPNSLRILEELLSDWLGDEAYMLQSPNAWREIIGKNDRIDAIEAWEMECFDNAWSEWFDAENKYALDDKQFFDKLIKPYTCFVGICIKLK